MNPGRSKTTKNKAEIKLPIPNGQEPVLVSGPKLRRLLDISAVTLWRWRNDENAEFPTATVINGRLYFPWADVQAWLAKQRQAA